MMGLFSKIFSKATSKWSRNIKLSTLYSASAGKVDRGIALARFNSIVDAHSSVEDIVEEFEIDGEDSEYQSLDGYDNCFTQSFEEEYERCEAEAELLSEFGIDVDPEELIDWERVFEDAYNYATMLVVAWLDGSEWIPEEILDWAWYDVSDHNQ